MEGGEKKALTQFPRRKNRREAQKSSLNEKLQKIRSNKTTPAVFSSWLDHQFYTFI
jgi:hypothetical protein